MTGKFNRYGIREIDHTTFGGIIYSSDFNTNYRENNTYGSPIASRIISDQKFDERCRKTLLRKQNGGNKK